MKEESSRVFLRRFRERPSSSLLFLDFDGTLSVISTSPEGATLHPAARRQLERLASIYRVCIVSGRPAKEVSALLKAEGISCFIGLHGLERLEEGVYCALRGADAFQGTMAEARGQITERTRRLRGVTVEDKGLIIAVHYRGCPEAAQQAEKAAALLAEEKGLVLHRGRMVLELRPPLPFGKGAAVEDSLRRKGAERALYAGDDLTDVDAFRSLHRMEEEIEGFSGLAVAVVSSESPRELLEECDLAVPGVDGVIDLLSRL